MSIRRALRTAAAAFFSLIPGGIAMAYEEPEYVVLATVNGVEYRRYAPYLVAETRVEDVKDRDRAANLGFRRLFAYISGENAVRLMEAGAPETAGSTKISMTTPVWQAPEPKGWTVAFVVPRAYDETNVPTPTSPSVTIRKVPGSIAAVWQYSGRWTDRVVTANRTKLMDRLAEAGIRPEGEVVTAYYNSPFTPPFLRRNEVMVKVSQVPVPG